MRVLISGSTGRMGQALKNVIAEENPYIFVHGFTTSPKLENEVDDLLKIKASDIDVVIDFSLPESFPKIFNWCKENKKPLVSGTTGFNLAEFKESGDFFPFMHSGNYSMGVAVLKESLSNLSVFKNAKIWIEDVHHIHKLDAPSGTALMLKDAIKSESEIEVQSIRGGSVFGVHKVNVVTESEWLTFTHQALNREVFARGALAAADWLRKRSSGFYQIGDFLKS